MKKRRSRILKRTRLIFGEGAVEGNFLRYLHKTYYVRTSAWSVKADNGLGGDPVSVLRQALQRTQQVDYDEVYLLLDTDREWRKEFKLEAEKNQIQLIGTTPCIEGLFLEILNDRSRQRRNSCHRAKSRFYKHHAKNKNQNIDHHCCERLFPKTTLDTRRHDLHILHQLIELFES